MTQLTDMPNIKAAIKQSFDRGLPVKLNKSILKFAATLPRGKVRDSFLTKFTILPSKELLKGCTFDIILYPKTNKNK